MPYAIMRFEKRKGGPASAIEKHHERKKPRYASNPDVDTDRSHLNYHLVEPDTNTTQRSSPASNRPSGKIRSSRCAGTA